MAQPPSLGGLSGGTKVQVLTQFDQTWASGFVIAGRAGAGYRLRRSSDGTILPTSFPPDRLRVAPPAKGAFHFTAVG